MLRDGQPYSAIRAATGRQNGTIGRIARAHGLTGARTAALRTRRARENRSAYSAERRAELAAKLTEEAERLLEEMRAPHTAFNFGGRDNTYAEHEMPEPPTEAKRHLMAATRDAVRTVLDIHRVDTRPEESPARAMVEALVEAVRGEP